MCPFLDVQILWVRGSTYIYMSTNNLSFSVFLKKYFLFSSILSFSVRNNHWVVGGAVLYENPTAYPASSKNGKLLLQACNCEKKQLRAQTSNHRCCTPHSEEQRLLQKSGTLSYDSLLHRQPAHKQALCSRRSAQYLLKLFLLFQILSLVHNLSSNKSLVYNYICSCESVS